MSRRLEPRDLRRRSSGGNLRTLPGRSLSRARGLRRQALIGLAGGLACAGSLSLQAAIARVDASWTASAGRTLIVVPHPSDLAAIMNAAGPGASRIEPGRVASLLGGSADAAPGLVIVPARHDPGLAARIEALAPGSIVEPDGGPPAEHLARFGDRLRLACTVLVGLVAAASLVILVAAARSSVLASDEAARLLHLLGITDGWLVRHLAWPLAAASLAGAAAGIGAAGLPILAADPSMDRWMLAAGAAYPLLAGLVAMPCASLVIRRRLQMRC